MSLCPDPNQTMKRNPPARLQDGRNARDVLCVLSVISAAISQTRRWSLPQLCGQASVLELLTRNVKRHLWNRNVLMRQDNALGDSVHLAKCGDREHRDMKTFVNSRSDRDR